MQSKHICNDHVKQRRHSWRILQVGLEIEGGKDLQTVEPRHTMEGALLGFHALPWSSQNPTSESFLTCLPKLAGRRWPAVGTGYHAALLGLSSTLALKNNEHGHSIASP
jgi:hypothetical protein